MTKLLTALAEMPARNGFSQVVSSAFALDQWGDLVKRYIARRATRLTLEELSDAQLRDIGLTRGMIEEAARSPRRYHTDY
jgi:uncharacterized protein YjiS (DUF1127 family)